MYDTIIIGAGMSGLAAGIRLAHYDQRVCILERHTTIGGLNSFYRQGGRNYDVGLHALTNFTPKGAKSGPLARLLRQLRFSWDDFSLIAAGRLGDHVSRAPRCEFDNDFDLFRSEVQRQFPAAKRQLRAPCLQPQRLRRVGIAHDRPVGPAIRQRAHHRSAFGGDDFRAADVLR